MADLTTLPEQIKRDQRWPLKYLPRLLHEEPLVLASAHSGTQGILALTETRLAFAWKVQALGTKSKATWRDRAKVVAAQLDGSDLLVRFDDQLLRYRNVSPDDRAAAILDALLADGAADSVIDTNAAPSVGPARSALNILPVKTRQLIEAMLRPDENVHVVFVGARGQAMVAADDRMLVAKSGFMAGATFGSKQTDFPYDQITGIELHVGPVNGYLQIQSPAFQANLPTSYWSRDKQHDPWKLPNCIPVGRASSTRFQPLLALVRERIAKGYWADGIGTQPVPPTSEPTPAKNGGFNLAGQIKELAALHETGALSEDEFERAKQKLLD